MNPDRHFSLFYILYIRTYNIWLRRCLGQPVDTFRFTSFFRIYVIRKLWSFLSKKFLYSPYFPLNKATFLSDKTLWPLKCVLKRQVFCWQIAAFTPTLAATCSCSADPLENKCLGIFCNNPCPKPSWRAITEVLGDIFTLIPAAGPSSSQQHLLWQAFFY